MPNFATLWPQILAALVVSAASWFVTRVVSQAAKRLENVATKDFVETTLKDHSASMIVEMGKLFADAKSQGEINKALDYRLRLLEGHPPAIAEA